MLIELLSTSNYVSYNIKLAEVLGLHYAIYISELTSINDKAIKKEKVDGKSFTIDREYIKKRTTFSEEEQIDIENNLIKLGILDKTDNEKDSIVLNITTLTTLMMSADEELIDNVKSLSKMKNKSQPKATAAEKIRQQLKSNIITTNQELKEAYEDWIDSVYAKQGWMSKKSVVVGQQVVDNFSQRNLDVALKLLEIASINAYRDMEWAVNKYREEYNISYKIKPNLPTFTVSPSNRELSEEVF